MPSLKEPRMVCFAGELYVLGGKNAGHERELTVEMFDSERNEWIFISQILQLKDLKVRKK